MAEIKKIEKNYDKHGNASHYDSNRLNSMVKFERVYGTLAVMLFCEISADKYRERIGKKEGQSLEQEVLKIEWYEKAAAYYLAKIERGEAIIVSNINREGLEWKQ